MRLIGKSLLLKLQKKNIGNKRLCIAIEQLIKDLESFDNSLNNLQQIRPDADCVHSEGFYFFDINIHRTLVLIEFDSDGLAEIIWVGSHDEYERTFRNNKSTIEKWLRDKEYIE